VAVGDRLRTCATDSHFGVGKDNEAMSRAAAAQGFDTVVFLKHKDNTNYPCGKEKQVDAKYMNVEVVAVKLKGTYACGTEHGSPSKDVLRALALQKVRLQQPVRRLKRREGVALHLPARDQTAIAVCSMFWWTSL
jgi:hypothetical protein